MKTPFFLRVLYIVAVVVVGIAGYVIHDIRSNDPPTTRHAEPVALTSEQILEELKRLQREAGGNPDRALTDDEKYRRWNEEYDKKYGRPLFVYCTDPRKGTYCPN